MKFHRGFFMIAFTLAILSNGIERLYAQTVAYGIDGSGFPTINFASVPLPDAGPITIIGETPAGGQGGDFGPDGLFYGRSGSDLVTISLEDGSISTVGELTGISAGQSITGMGYDEAGEIMYLCGTDFTGGVSDLYTLDLMTAEASSVGTITNASSVLALAVSPAGDIYAFDDGSDNLVWVDAASGAGTIIGSLAIETVAQDADFDSETGALYWASFADGSGRLATVDVTSATVTPVTSWDADFIAFAIFNPKPTSVQATQSQISYNFRLQQNYPNPFNPETVIEYHLAEAGYVELAIFNVLGEKVRQLAAEHVQAGSHRLRWDGRDDSGKALSGGLYFYRLRTPTFSQSRKMVLAK